MKLLIEAGARVENSLLYAVSAYGDERDKITRMLIAAGADVNIKNNCGLTALLLAARKNCEVLSVLLAARADVNAKDAKGQTALMRSIK
ncbi:ankyrin repeat domain-containing protein [Desulfobacterales bacterium HSG17]|nr:ankyrin repeat domain-containing protein [Desulfobacterales bacterium HSG17]